MIWMVVGAWAVEPDASESEKPEDAPVEQLELTPELEERVRKWSKRSQEYQHLKSDWWSTENLVKEDEAAALMHLDAFLERWAGTPIWLDDEEPPKRVNGIFEEVDLARALQMKVVESRQPGRFGVDMVKVEAGSFQMGSPAEELGRKANETLHEVELTKPFLLQKTEMSQGAYKSIMGGHYRAPEDERCAAVKPSIVLEQAWRWGKIEEKHYAKKAFKHDDKYAVVNVVGDDLPVVCVPFEDVIRMLNRMSTLEGYTPAYTVDNGQVTWDREADGYRLPTEAEWEYAARAGSNTVFAGGGPEQACAAANLADLSARNGLGKQKYHLPCDDGHVGPAPVGSLAANAFGLHDMNGNVREWVWDKQEPHPSEKVTDPVGSGAFRGMRGGNWEDGLNHGRLAHRFEYTTLGTPKALYSTGFRIARNAD